MEFNGFNSDDFNCFNRIYRDSDKREKLKVKIRKLAHTVYNDIPNIIRSSLNEPKIGRLLDTSEDLWFSIRLNIQNEVDNINYNFDISEDGIRYCLNAETVKAIKLFKYEVSNNINEFLRLVNNIDGNKIWLYEREPAHGISGKYLSGKPYPPWNEISYYNDILNSEDISNIFTKITNLDNSAVRIGKSYGKDDTIARSQELPEHLVKLTKTYYKLFKFLNNL